MAGYGHFKYKSLETWQVSEIYEKITSHQNSGKFQNFWKIIQVPKTWQVMEILEKRSPKSWQVSELDKKDKSAKTWKVMETLIKKHRARKFKWWCSQACLGEIQVDNCHCQTMSQKVKVAMFLC